MRHRLVCRALYAAATCALAGCVDSTLRIGGYLWEKNPSAPVCETVIWRQVDRSRIPGLCMDSVQGAAPEGASCALSCVVVSPYSESEARRRMIFGDSLYDHEARHVLEGLAHPRAIRARAATQVAGG